MLFAQTDVERYHGELKEKVDAQEKEIQALKQQSAEKNEEYAQGQQIQQQDSRALNNFLKDQARRRSEAKAELKRKPDEG